MASTPNEQPRTREEAKASDGGKAGAADAKGEGNAAVSAPGGGLKPWLPLIVAVVCMPMLAFATMRLVLLPKLERAVNQTKPGAAVSNAPAEAARSEKEGEKAGGDKAKVTVALSKMLVNVAGTMGTRYLMTSVTLVGNTTDFKSKIDENKDQLMDLATSTLSSKTIADLEKPGARNVIRAELMTVFNEALGAPLVQEIYITELAIQ
jgi:flagellar FliL protein